VSDFSAVIFDNDGLTLDTEVVWTHAEKQLFAEHGQVFTPELKLQLVGSAGPVAAAKLTTMLGLPIEHGADLMRRLHVLVLAELERGCAPMPGARELLAELARREIPVALCSNSPRAIVEAALRGSGMNGSFAATIAGDDGHRQKPEPDAYLTAAAALGADPARCAALEDSPTGARSARSAGMRVIGVPSVPGVVLDDVCHEVHTSLAAPALWRSLGLEPAPGAG
jgi:HAD superfamily hydrolase (TIGR01509 family)